MSDTPPQNEHDRPQSGDVVISDVEESEQLNQSYWVRTQSRDSAASLFEGPDAWAKARAAAEERAGQDSAVWRHHRDGHFERLSEQ
jgi:hypothetical protein